MEPIDTADERQQELFRPMEVTLLGNDQVQIRACSCCGGEHDRTTLHRLASPVMPYTNYFYCLDRLHKDKGFAEPVLISIAVTGGEAMTPDPKILASLAAAAGAGRWMAAIWWIGPPNNPKVDPRPTIRLDRFSRDWPNEDVDRALALLTDDLGQISGKIPPEPLKPATIPRGAALNLFPGSPTHDG